MAAFGGQLNDVEIAAVISYTRHAWSNAGKGQDPTVQLKDVTAGADARAVVVSLAV